MPFIAFEGLDGSGKSTLMKMILNILDQKKINYETTREPGGTALGDYLRDIIINKGPLAPAPHAELLLYEASRAQLVEVWLKPRLQKKIWVLADRFAASSIAFQAGGRNLLKSQVEWLNQFATQGIEPDLYILLDVSVEESKKRRQKRADELGTGEDRIESEKADFHQRVRDEFLKLAQEKPSQWLVLSANLSHEQMLDLVLTQFKERGWLR